MATTNTKAVNFNIYPVGNEGMSLMIPRQAAATYANGDIIKGPKLERDLKIVDAIAAGGELDSNAPPTATAKLRLNDGSTQVNLISIDATTLGSADWVQRINLQAAVGYVIPTRGFWLELVFDAAFATAAAAALVFGVTVSPCMFGDEGPLAPTGG